MIIILALLALACSANPFAKDEPTQEPPTAEPVATKEPEPTNTPQPSPTPEPTSPPTAEPAPTQEPQSSTDVLESAGQAMSELESMHMSLDMQLTMGGEGLGLDIPIVFEGDFQAPDKSAGTLSFSFLGIAIEMETITIGDTTYTTNFETGEWEISSGDTFFDLDQFGIPVASPESFLDMGPDVFSDLQVVGEESLNGVSTIHMRGSMSLDDVIGTGDLAELNVWIGVDDHYMHQMTIEGQTVVEDLGDSPFGGGEVDMLITITMSNFNEPVDIQPPDGVTDVISEDPFIFETPIRSVAFSPDGLILATGANDGNITLWDMDMASKLATLPGHTDWIRSVAFSPDGQWLASGSDDTSVLVWDVDNPTALPEALFGHEDWVRSVSFSPDSQTLATGSDDHTVRLWDVSDFTTAPTVLDSESYIFSVAFSPDGETLAAGSESGIYLWNLNDPSASPVILEGHSDWVESVAFSPDGHYLASGSDDRSVLVWDMTNLDADPTTLLGHTDWVQSVAFSPDGSQLASAGDDMVILLWDVADLNAPPTPLVGHEDWITSVAFSPVNNLLTSAGQEGLPYLWILDLPGEYHILSE
jgi:WD40 repeat protein